MKRKLTDTEIENILEVIPLNKSVPRTVAISTREQLFSSLRKQLRSVEIDERGIEDLKQMIGKEYHKSVIAPGESVGIITAQSIGEKHTQSTLNSFHQAGLSIKSVVTGVPRFGELINATKDPKAISCQVFLKKKYNTIDSIRKDIGCDFIQLTIGQIIKSVNIYTKDEKLPGWYREWDMLYGTDYKKEEYTTFIRYKINPSAMIEHRISLTKIKKSIENVWGDVCVVCSPEKYCTVDVYVSPTENYDPVEYAEIIVSNKLLSFPVCGIDGIMNVFYTHNSGNWIIETENENKDNILRELFSHPLVDYTKTISNNVWDIYNTLGIEAARQFLVEEVGNVVSDGSYVNDSHIKLLVDVMTFPGTIVSISRYFMKKQACGPLAKAAFEESLDNFLRSGLFGEKENINGVSAAIMLGKAPKVGTGAFDVLIDVEQLDKLYLKQDVVEVSNMLY
jgi:DNA-directed RNA polymerase beta' subunit